MSLRRVTVSGVEWAYEERGDGAPALVLLHGYTGCWRDFEGPLPALAEARRVLVPELPGHGGSARLAPDAYTFDHMTALLIAFLDAVGEGPVHLLGHSMGGMLALRVALQAPDRLASLLLMDTSAQRLGWIQLPLLEAAGRIGREAGMDKLAAILRARADDDADRSDADRRVEKEWGAERFWSWRDERIMAMDPEAYPALGRAMAEAGDLESRLGEITCPTLVLCGDQDEPFLGPSRRLAEGIPGATLAWLAGAAHQPQNENPAAWLDAVSRHLAG